MRRYAFIGAVVALAGGGAAYAQSQQPVQKPPLRATLEACQTGTDPFDRYAVFTGSMPSAKGVAAMAMRFDLFERTPGAGFQHVTLPKWGTWERTTKAGVPGFIFTKRVDQLAAPAAYRAVVSFRWYDKKGAVVRSDRRKTPICQQPDPRPDLHVKHVGFQGRKVSIVMRNRGRGDAGAFDVSAGLTGQPPVSQSVSGLPAGGQSTVTLTIGRCTPGSMAKIVLDSAGVVDEADETDDAVSVTCPAR